MDHLGALRAAGSVFAEEELAALASAAPDEASLVDLVARRCAGEPVEYILGKVDFGGLTLRIQSGVFIPRRRTVALARRVAARLPGGGRLLDLACGAAPISAYVVDRDPSVRVTACDLDPRAVDCARTNLPLDAIVVTSDLFDEVPAGRFDVIAANLPYVPTSQLHLMPRDSRDHEPVATCDGGADGLDVLRRVAPELDGRLRSGGSFLTEVARDQIDEATVVLAGLRVRVGRSKHTCVIEARR